MGRKKVSDGGRGEKEGRTERGAGTSMTPSLDLSSLSISNPSFKYRQILFLTRRERRSGERERIRFLL